MIIGVIDRQGHLGKTVQRAWPAARIEMSFSGALDLLHQGAVEVIFLRIMDMDSWEGDILHCLVQSRRQGRCVLVVSPEDVATGVYGWTKGCSDFIVTPVTEESIRRALEKVRALSALGIQPLLQEKTRSQVCDEDAYYRDSTRRFLVEIRHEINTSLHGILNFARFGIKEVKRARCSPERNRLLEYFQEIESAGSHLMRVVRRLEGGLFRRNRKGRTSFVRERFSTVVGAVIREIEKAYPCEEIQVVFRRPGADDLVEMDTEKIKQVMRHVLLTAIQYNDDRRKKIVVTVDVDLETVWFSVGRFPYPQGACMDKGLRGDSPGLEKLLGQGRMAVLRGIVRTHQGQIWFGSTNEDLKEIVRFGIARYPVVDAFAPVR